MRTGIQGEGITDELGFVWMPGPLLDSVPSGH